MAIARGINESMSKRKKNSDFPSLHITRCEWINEKWCHLFALKNHWCIAAATATFKTRNQYDKWRIGVN